MYSFQGHLGILTNSFGLIFLLFFITPFILAQSDSRKSIKAHPIDQNTEIQLDGKVDEEFWLEIQPSGGFLMREPVEGGKPTELTEIRIAYNAKFVILSVVSLPVPVQPSIFPCFFSCHQSIGNNLQAYSLRHLF